MLKAEMKLAARLLKRAADEFSNHGCNDMSNEDFEGLTPEELEELRGVYNEFLKNDPSGHWDISDVRYTMDWLWMSILAKKLEAE